jgi:hypothetical protein
MAGDRHCEKNSNFGSRQWASFNRRRMISDPLNFLPSRRISFGFLRIWSVAFNFTASKLPFDRVLLNNYQSSEMWVEILTKLCSRRKYFSPESGSLQSRGFSVSRRFFRARSLREQFRWFFGPEMPTNSRSPFDRWRSGRGRSSNTYRSA